MATFNSTQISNAQLVGSNSSLLKAEERATVRHGVVTFEVTTAMIDNADDNILLLAIPSDAIIHELIIYNDDLDSNGSPTLAANVGVFTINAIPGYAASTVIDADCIATAITTLQAANTLGVNIAFEARDIANINQPLWQTAGLTSDPAVDLAITLDITTAAATAAAGTITVVCKYVHG